eukprot:1161820-Pelagomonas_calceolata.AAC.6
MASYNLEQRRTDPRGPHAALRVSYLNRCDALALGGLSWRVNAQAVCVQNVSDLRRCDARSVLFVCRGLPLADQVAHRIRRTEQVQRQLQQPHGKRHAVRYAACNTPSTIAGSAGGAVAAANAAGCVLVLHVLLL